jgi:hypothetical protein
LHFREASPIFSPLTKTKKGMLLEFLFRKGTSLCMGNLLRALFSICLRRPR